MGPALSFLALVFSVPDVNGFVSVQQAICREYNTSDRRLKVRKLQQEHSIATSSSFVVLHRNH
jgi:hypothetical protein